MSWGNNGGLGGDYANNGLVTFTGASGWYIIQTIESFNGQRVTFQGNFIDWFSPNAFGALNYLNTPVGGVTHVEEPSLGGINSSTYWRYWGEGRTFGIAAWNSWGTPHYQAVGDPLVAH
jgi:hypothetical protein